MRGTFGPVAPLLRFTGLEQVIRDANSLDYGLAAFAFTASLKTATELGNRSQSGMVSINHFGLALPETPFGGIKASGHGSEGGSEGLDAYLTTKSARSAAEARASPPARCLGTQATSVAGRRKDQSHTHGTPADQRSTSKSMNARVARDGACLEVPR